MAIGFGRGDIGLLGARENSVGWREYFTACIGLYHERFDATRFSPGAGCLGFVIPMPRYVCPGGSQSLRGLFLSSPASDLQKTMNSRLTTPASGALALADQLADWSGEGSRQVVNGRAFCYGESSNGRSPGGGPGESDPLERPHTMCGLDRKRSRKRSVAARLWAAVVERG